MSLIPETFSSRIAIGYSILVTALLVASTWFIETRTREFHEEEVERTTPEAVDLQATFARMLEAGDGACAMEVSSHALELGRARGIRFGLVTSKNRQGAERGLRLMGVQEEFEVIVGADDVVNPKPHAEPVLQALERMAVRKEHAVYIGDSVHDMESGRAAGVRTAAVLWGPFVREQLAHTRPDYWLEKPEQLETLGR